MSCLFQKGELYCNISSPRSSSARSGSSSAVAAAPCSPPPFPDVGIGLLGVSLAFGLTVLTMAYAIGHISGCHFNPAVSVGLWSRPALSAGEVLPYIVAQVVGAIVGAGVLYVIASGKPGFEHRRRLRLERLRRRTRRAATRWSAGLVCRSRADRSCS